MRITDRDDPKFADSAFMQYYLSIQRGDIIAGLELQGELDNLLESLGGDCYFDDTEPKRIIKFMETCCRLTHAPFYGKPMQLMLWQKAFIEALFGFRLTATGGRRFRRCLLLISRKNGKTELAAALLLYMLLAGGQGLEMVCSSCNDRASGVLYNNLDNMRQQLDPKNKITWRNINALSSPHSGNKIFRLSDSARAKEGYNIDIAVIDEAHELLDDNVVQAIEQSQSTKEDSLLLIITTEGFINDGFLDKELVNARQVIKNEKVDRVWYRYLPWLYTVDSEKDIWQGDEANRRWEKANPSLGPVKKYSFLAEQVSVARGDASSRAFVLAKDFNLKQGQAHAWLNVEDYTYAHPEIEWDKLKKMQAVGGVDIAETTDLTSARVLIPVDGKLITMSHYWMPAIKLEQTPDKGAGAKYDEWRQKGLLTITDGAYTDPQVVADWYYELYQKYRWYIISIGYDQRFAKAFVEKAKYYGFESELVWQNAATLHPAIKMAEADLKLKKIWGLNEIDKWCIGNATLQINAKGEGLLSKIRGQAQRRIDGAVSLAIAYNIYNRHRNELRTEA